MSTSSIRGQAPPPTAEGQAQAIIATHGREAGIQALRMLGDLLRAGRGDEADQLAEAILIIEELLAARGRCH